MAEQSSMLWFNEAAPMHPNWLHALTLPVKHPSTAGLISDFKEPQMSDEIAVNREKSTLETRNHDAKIANAMDTIAKAINDVFEDVHWADANQNELGSVLDANTELRSENASLRARLANQQVRVKNQRAMIENFQRKTPELDQPLGLSELATFKAKVKGQADHIKALEAKVERLTPQADETVKAKLERALHTQKILERDLEEYQQAYADLKASVFSDDDRTLPPRLLAFGHGDYLVYPAKVCASDDGTAPKWGIVIDPNTPLDRDALDQLIDKNLVLTDGDVAITFEKPSDVTRLIDTLQDVVWRMYRDLTFKPE